MYNANMTKHVIWANVLNVLRKDIKIAKE